jgi:hypothetical protein
LLCDCTLRAVRCILQITDAIWPIIANTEVLAVSQAYAGNSGGLYDKSETLVFLTDAHIDATNAPPVGAPAFQYLYKPIGDGKVAVLLMNVDATAQILSADFAKIPNLSCTHCQCAAHSVAVGRVLHAA